MYNIDEELQDEVQSWIDKLPDSIVKSQITDLFDNVFPTQRMTVEQVEKFLSYQNALPKEFQAYPQTFVQILKNPHEDTENVLAESHEHIGAKEVSGAKGKEKKESLHKLGQRDKTKAGKGKKGKK